MGGSRAIIQRATAHSRTYLPSNGIHDALLACSTMSRRIGNGAREPLSPVHCKARTPRWC